MVSAIVRQGRLVIAMTFVIALLLTALPMPESAAIWRPAWVALVLIYWCMAAPEQVGVVVGWMTGLLLDVMTGTLLGQHALGLSVVAWFAHYTHRRVRVQPLWRQAVSVFVLLFLYQALVLWSNGIRGIPVAAVTYWTAPLLGTLLWPWLFVVLRVVRRRYAAV